MEVVRCYDYQVVHFDVVVPGIDHDEVSVSIDLKVIGDKSFLADYLVEYDGKEYRGGCANVLNEEDGIERAKEQIKKLLNDLGLAYTNVQ